MWINVPLMDTDPMCTKFFTGREQNKMSLSQKVSGLNKFQRNAMVRSRPCRTEESSVSSGNNKFWGFLSVSRVGWLWCQTKEHTDRSFFLIWNGSNLLSAADCPGHRRNEFTLQLLLFQQGGCQAFLLCPKVYLKQRVDDRKMAHEFTSF